MIGYAPMLGQVRLASHAGFRMGQLRHPQDFDDFIKKLCSDLQWNNPDQKSGYAADALALIDKSGYSFRDVDAAMLRTCSDPSSPNHWTLVRTYIGRPRDFPEYVDRPTTYGQLEEVAAYYKNLSDPEFPGYDPGFGDQAERNYLDISARLQEIASDLCPEGLGQVICATPDKDMPLSDIQTYVSPGTSRGIPALMWLLGGIAAVGVGLVALLK